MNHDPVDIVGLLVALFALIVSKEIAALVGPYAAVVVLAAAGAALALSGVEKQLGAFRAVLYVSVRVLVAIVATVALAEFFQLFASWAKPRYTLAPIAFLIGWIQDYKTFMAKALEFGSSWISRKVDDGK